MFDLSRQTALQQGDKLMLCSDGLWGSLSDADMVEQLGHLPVDEAVPDLVGKALQKAGERSDNVTVLALEWETPDGFASTRGNISTDAIHEGSFASTVQAGTLDVGLEDLGEADIERSIAEINEAIRRTAAKKG